MDAPPASLQSNLSHSTFPPPGIVLHPEDATNKIFLAIARAFVSVDNRAMTIKDIADRASRYGLVCQNLSAAAQAVTTYIRAHKARCDKQDDIPLLLSHTLSGTPADDDLLPALFSRSGGDSHPLPLPNRLTNFRKGTAVWYLSRATGVHCPFTRAGIRLCDYVSAPEPSSSSSTSFSRSGTGSASPMPDAGLYFGLGGGVGGSGERKRKRARGDQICGQKRKRPLRGCVAARGAAAAPGLGASTGSDNERPPKVKLTLRLKPLLPKPTLPPALVDVQEEGSSSAHPIAVPKEDEGSSGEEVGEDGEDEDSMSVDDSSDDQSHTAMIADKDQEEPWSLPPYPRRSISIPCYTPTVETFPPSSYKDYYSHPSTFYRRSPSVHPYDVATPPPDSEDETDDFHVAMARIKDYSEREDDMGWDADLDSEGEGETVFESPGPRSPSAPLIQHTMDVAVKEEPRDVQGMLDAWEDFDSSVADARVADVLAKALELEAEMESQKVKQEPLDASSWAEWTTEDTVNIIKQEDFGVESLFPVTEPGPLSPLSALSSQLSAFSYSDTSANTSASSSSPPQQMRNSHSEMPDWAEDERERQFATVRPRAKTVPARSPFFIPPTSSSMTATMSNGNSNSRTSSHEPSVPSTALVRLLQSMSVNTSTLAVSLPPPTPCVSPLQTRCQPVQSTFTPVVVTTCSPCKPAISATQIEDISVYQMMLGAFQLLRRIDTDFVNLSPIVAYAGGAPLALAGAGGGNGRNASSTLANATLVTKGSPEVSGTWVPLSAAQAYVKEHLTGDKAKLLEVFLSDTLVERFPTALQDFHRSTSMVVRGLNQFGRHFASTLQAAKWDVQGDGSTTTSTTMSAATVPGASAGMSGGGAAGQTTTRHSQPPVSVMMAPPLVVVDKSSGRQREVQDDVVPLSASEQLLFHELCVIPDEMDGDDVVMGVDVVEPSVVTPAPVVAPISTLPPVGAVSLSSGALPQKEEEEEEEEEALEEPMSPLSPLPPSPSAAAPMLIPPMSPLILSPALGQDHEREKRAQVKLSIPPPTEQKQEREQRVDERPLRRSKRVADALHAATSHPTPSRARSRKNGSRNSLS